MARIAGVNIPNHQHTVIGLTAIYGIGRPRAEKICQATGVLTNKKVKVSCSNDRKISILEQEKLTNKMKSLINSYEDQLSELQNQIAKKAVNESKKFTVENIDEFDIIEKADEEECNIEGNFICVICLTNKRNCCFIDCGHLLCCFECSLNNDPNYTLKTLKLCINEYNVTNGAIVCPLCKRLNKKYRKIFF